MKERKGTERNRRANGEGTLVKVRGVWYAVFTVAGKRVWRTTGKKRREDAERRFRELQPLFAAAHERRGLRALADRLAALADDRAGRAVGARLDGLWALFAKDPNRPDCGARNMENYRHHLDRFVAWAAQAHPEATLACDVTQTVADEYYAHRQATRSQNTANKDVNALALVWSTLARTCALGYNPWSRDKIRRRKVAAKSRRTLTAAEVERLVASAGGELRALMALGAETPLRLSDAVSLRWGEVDASAGMIVRRTSKTGAVVAVPVTARLAEELGRLPRGGDGDPVLPGLAALPDGAASRRAAAHFRACGIETRTAPDAKGRTSPLAGFHSFRHTWASRMVAKGVPPAVVQRAMGHASLQMTGHYTHLELDAIRRAFAAT